jgi:hypothetical protein
MVGKFLHHDYKDAEVWYDAGRRVLTGETLAGLPHYRYPPTFAVLVAPLAALGFPAFFFLWYGINLGLFGVSLWLAGEIADSRGRMLPAVLVAVYAMDTLFLGQTNILIMALVYWAFLEEARGRQWLAGLPLGAAIAIKVFPAPLVLYFAFRLRWRVIAAAVLWSLFFLLLLPGAARGFQRNLAEVGDWADRVALPFVSRGEAGDWGQHALDFGNQSLTGVAGRLLMAVNAQVAARPGPDIYVNVADLDAAELRGVVLALSLALGLFLVWAIGWRRPADGLRRSTEYALAVTLLLLTSALSWTYFFVMLLLPVTVAVRLLAEGDRIGRVSVGLLKAALLAVGAATALLASQYARALGCVFWASLLLFFALALAAFRLRRQAMSRSHAPTALPRPPAPDPFLPTLDCRISTLGRSSQRSGCDARRSETPELGKGAICRFRARPGRLWRNHPGDNLIPWRVGCP